MDQMDRVLPYLAELGALHQRHGVAKQHIDLLGLAFCAAIRGVVQVRREGEMNVTNKTEMQTHMFIAWKVLSFNREEELRADTCTRPPRPGLPWSRRFAAA